MERGCGHRRIGFGRKWPPFVLGLSQEVAHDYSVDHDCQAIEVDNVSFFGHL